MNANKLGFDIYAMAAPKSIQDLIAMIKEARAELKIINCYLDAMFEENTCPKDA